MELMTTKLPHYYADKIVENYETLIWTERYDSSGDFQVTGGNVEALLELLPLESVVALRESTVPMLVEVHKIEKKPGAPPKLTVTGRSFETVLERRVSVNALAPSTARAVWTIDAASESDAAYMAIRTVIGDYLREDFDEIGFLPLVDPFDPLDALDIEQPLPADFNFDDMDNTYEIKPGSLYATVLELIRVNHHGIKATRPFYNDGGTGMAIEIYNGANRTGEGVGSLDPVVFDARFDQFDSATYLLSKAGSTNVAYVYGPNGAQKVLKTSGPEPSGLERRVVLLDLSSEATATTTDIRTARGLIELYNHNQTALFDGQISVQVAEGYNVDYFLGDLIKLNGEYGLSQNVRVAEFIRTSDATGEKAYPAFQAVD